MKSEIKRDSLLNFTVNQNSDKIYLVIIVFCFNILDFCEKIYDWFYFFIHSQTHHKFSFSMEACLYYLNKEK